MAPNHRNVLGEFQLASLDGGRDLSSQPELHTSPLINSISTCSHGCSASQPYAFISRSTDPAKIPGMLRWFSAIIFHRTYRPSAVSLRSPSTGPTASTTGPSASTMLVASRTALRTVEEQTVRGDTC